jgi:signal transduction histidine kinase
MWHGLTIMRRGSRSDISVRQLVVGVRAALLVICVSLTLIDRQDAGTIAALSVLAVVAALATIPVRKPRLARPQPVLEAVVACLLVLTLQPLPESLLPYLLAPALAGGLMFGFISAVMVSGLGALVLLLGRFVADQPGSLSSYLGKVSQWGLITLAVGLLGAWVHRLLLSQGPPENAAYAAAYRLISQLRLVSRQLSGGLDPVTLSEGLLEQLGRAVPFARGSVYVRATGGRLSPLATIGADRLDWDVANPLFDEAWASSVPTRQSTPLSAGQTGSSAAIPLQIGLRTFGLVAIERAEPFESADLDTAAELLEEQALRLETALLFSEVRTLATAEERRRLAREIHDGIAQELASLGYVVDDLAARARFLPDLQADIKALRGELTRVITELRLSIFDLRSEVHTTIGLGTALSDYVRQVGVGSHFTVHLVLDESPTRLAIDAETELLRIAQEAITNARKHANAQNLWVTCSVNPPTALLRVEDDGQGLGRPREDSFGLEVMRERAERVGAHIQVRNREEGGTMVEVTLGAARVAR